VNFPSGLYHAVMRSDPTIIVLSKVNAPHAERISVEELCACFFDFQKSKAWSGHVSSFFAEVSPAMQIAFAARHGIDKTALVNAAKAFAAWSGENYEIAA
jgi:hypothetical protein